jgi:hypothetical protein
MFSLADAARDVIRVDRRRNERRRAAGRSTA